MALAIFLFVVAIVFFAGLGSFLLVLGLGIKRVDRRVATEGKITEGQVTGTRMRMRSTGRTRVPQYFAIVTYLVDGQSYEQVHRITEAHYELWGTGARVFLQYLPSNPKLSFLLADRTEQQMPLGCFFGAGAAFAGAVAMLIMMVVFVLRAWH